MVQMLNEKPKLLEIKPFKIGGYEIRSCEYGAYCVLVKEEKKMNVTNLEYLREKNNCICEALCDLNDNSECVVCGSKTNCYDCNVRNLKWLLEEHKGPFLTDSERQYLSAAIKPFRSEVCYIEKSADNHNYKQFIYIEIEGCGFLSFPFFETNSMYKGMELDKKYTLEELGL